MLNDNFGPMKESLRRVTQYQRVACSWQPGYGEDAYLIGINEYGIRAQDVFCIKNDGHLNRAINILLGRIYA